MKKIKSVYLSARGQVVCSDEQDQQIGELQKSFRSYSLRRRSGPAIIPKE